MTFKIHFRKFHVLAVRMLNECYNDDKELTRELITLDSYVSTRRPPIKGVTTLEIAAAVGKEEFVAHSSCQNLLNLKWFGELKLEEDRKFKVQLFD